MYLEIVTPDKKIFSGDILGVQVPGQNGSFEMLNNHAAIVSSLGKGKLRISTKQGITAMTVEGGIVELIDNKVVVLAETVTED
jgi:F-type H+-transporting ATPase subunit epsilon